MERRVAAAVSAKMQLAPPSPAETEKIAALAVTSDANTLAEMQADTRAAALMRADRVRWEGRNASENADAEELRQLRQRILVAEEEVAAKSTENTWLKEELRREKERNKAEQWDVALKMLQEHEAQSGAAAATMVSL